MNSCSNIVTFYDIGEAHYFVLKECLEKGELIPVDAGSYEKELNRLQLPYISFRIYKPSDFGWLSDPKVKLTSEQINRYFRDYLMSAEKSENETYRYGNRILESAQLNEAIQKLNKGYTNQAAIAISKPSDIQLDDPPCLRELVFGLDKGRLLNMTMLWRSWDLWNALPLNLSGLAQLHELVCGFIPEAKMGAMYVSAANAHIYDNMIPFAKEYIKGGSV